MIRNLKVLGLALVAVFSFAAISASGAMAANGKLTSDGPVTLDATEIAGQLNRLTAFGTVENPGVTECPGSTITGHKYAVTPHEFIPNGAETVTLTPDYNQVNCKAIEGGITHKATVTMNGCDYVLHVGETHKNAKGEPEPDIYDTTVDIVCPMGSSIIVDVYFSASNENLKICEITVGPQAGKSGATVTDETNGHLAIHGTYTGISASKSGTCGSATTNTASFHANLTVTGTNEVGLSTEVGLSHL